MSFITARQQCQSLATILQFTGDVHDDNALMNYMLCYCLKRTLKTRQSDYLRVWFSLRNWEHGLMSYGELAYNLQALINLDKKYAEHH